MFIIIGGDGREYGPATAEQIRGWMAAGRANLATKAKAAGTDEWRTLGDFAEFAPPSATTPPPMEIRADVIQPELADPGIRLLAAILDPVIAMIVAAPGAMMIGLSFFVELMRNPLGAAPAEPTSQQALGALLLLASGFILLVVQIVLLTTRGQTLGKIVFGIRIVRIEDNANPGFIRAVLLRWFVPALIMSVPFVGFFFFLVDSCFIFRADHRCIHDLMANTRVVKV